MWLAFMVADENVDIVVVALFFFVVLLFPRFCERSIVLLAAS